MNFDTKTRQLTRAELHLMNILWEKGQATVNELQAELPEPKPAYTTTLTVMQVLTRKGIVTFERQGKTNVYRPLMKREEYVAGFLDEARNTLFKGSLSAFLTFFAKHEKISRSEMEKILKEMAQ
ncbi:MAG: BlaI/MecI/CopY family transcriptional regulator [Bacteroidaceae bacterium]|nr:BlaI/MecI/CopY family transcriptional regulator [Bacteroidaceae bacterium]